ncbi:type II toxin-antitoxin system RatA family toxin [Maritalea mediterranea]|uniref:Type II toxin-antitoxin system RatA family toxin n=1 Tax=Maritalea mediterranea TaxID=2909667 RepID=A0ABS9EAQ3_9HYPH|nr:type II toxin-antitoxin system RatA family toxin [Maritalea mediterranea]MCF4098521.1 type II toxin-antitoxin system RatA family toxin [Maritalea mediterranea]
MTKIAFERHVSYTPEQMFDLVADLRGYPTFVPNCSNMHVRPGPTDTSCYARMGISFGPISQDYESRVELDRQNKRIRATAVDGPFSHLESEWLFLPEGEGTHIQFKVDFKLSNRLIAAVAEPLFATKQEEIMDAFVRRAGELYGK